MGFSKRTGIGFPFAPTITALVCALMSPLLNASVIPISSSANLAGATGGLTFGGSTSKVTQDVSNLLAINTSSARNTALFNVGLRKILRDAAALSGNGDRMLFNNGILILSGSGSNETGSTNTTDILELGNSNFTLALGAGAGQVNMNSASGGAGFAAFGADRVVNLWGIGAENVTLSSGSITGTGTGILTASSYAIQSGTGSPILAGPAPLTKPRPDATR